MPPTLRHDARIPVAAAASSSIGRGQSWVVTIEALARDRRTASNIDDQAFVRNVAELLGVEVMDC